MVATHKDCRDWIKKVLANGHKVYHRVCTTEISLGGSDVSVLDIYVKGKEKHSLKCPAIHQPRVHLVHLSLTKKENDPQ